MFTEYDYATEFLDGYVRQETTPSDGEEVKDEVEDEDEEKDEEDEEDDDDEEDDEEEEGWLEDKKDQEESW